MKLEKNSSSFLFYFLVFIFFFIDLIAFSIQEKLFFYTLLCFYIMQLSRPISIFKIIFACTVLCITPLIVYGRFGLTLLYLIPATFLGIIMRHTLYKSYWQYYALLIACLLVQIYVIEYAILHLPVSGTYTISILFVNIVMIWLISLKL